VDPHSVVLSECRTIHEQQQIQIEVNLLQILFMQSSRLYGFVFSSSYFLRILIRIQIANSNPSPNRALIQYGLKLNYLFTKKRILIITNQTCAVVNFLDENPHRANRRVVYHSNMGQTHSLQQEFVVTSALHHTPISKI
jgi:hypothetical protein